MDYPGSTTKVRLKIVFNKKNFIQKLIIHITAIL